VIIQYSGLIPYQKGLELQQQSFDLVRANGRPVLIGCEHYPVITLGRRVQADGEFLISRQDLQSRGLEIFATDRGGQATLHTPGQLVIYPMIPLRDYKISVRDFVKTLELTTVEWLRLHKIAAFISEEAGVFTENGKIAFVGIRVQNGVSRHGLAINLHNDLNLFQTIRSCGVSGRSLDSLERHGQIVDISEAFDQWTSVFVSQLIALRELAMQRGNDGFSH
jgi:lipoate-protein ligase B